MGGVNFNILFHNPMALQNAVSNNLHGHLREYLLANGLITTCMHIKSMYSCLLLAGVKSAT